MDYIRGLEAYQDSREAAITLGKFDGVHRGHQKLIKKVCQLKVKKGVRSVVFAFDMNPLYEKLGKSREGIMSNEERRCLLDGKVDVLLECPFSEDVTSMSAEDFIRKILIEKIHARYIVIGTDFHFGHDKRGAQDPEAITVFIGPCLAPHLRIPTVWFPFRFAVSGSHPAEDFPNGYAPSLL